MNAGPSYLLFPAAFALVICALLSVHIRYKPPGMDWSYYDPTFVYALKELPEELAQKSCQAGTVLGFGTSALGHAVARSGSSWLRWNHWRRYDGPLDHSRNIFSIVRNANADLRMLYPILSLLPDCQKVIVLHASVLLPGRVMNHGGWQYLIDMLTDSPGFYFGSFIERYWEKPYQIDFHKKTKHIKQTDKVFDSAKHLSGGIKHRGNLRRIIPRHREIIMELVDNNAEILIVDIGRSKEWEETGASQMASFRSILRAFASSSDAIHYRRFSSIATKYYSDYTHMNSEGAEIFRPWLAANIAELNASTDGLR